MAKSPKPKPLTMDFSNWQFKTPRSADDNARIDAWAFYSALTEETRKRLFTFSDRYRDINSAINDLLGHWEKTHETNTV